MNFKIVEPSIGRKLAPHEEQLMADLGITYNEDYFSVGEVDFDKLSDAVMFAKENKVTCG